MKEKKCRVYGYEEYEHYYIRLGWLMKDYQEGYPNYYYYTDKLFKDWEFSGCLIADGMNVPHIDALCSWKTDNQSVKDLLGKAYRVPTDGETVYFMHGCTIPHTKFKGQWKSASRINKADSIVIPDFRKWSANEGYALFINEATKELWIMDLGYDSCPINMFNKRCETGDPFFRCVKKLSPKWYNRNCYTDSVLQSSLANAMLTYSGTMFQFPANQIPLLETLLGKMTNVVFESHLAALLDESPSNEFSVDTFENLYNQLGSNSFDTVVPALKCLASLNYNRSYRNAVTLLLDMTLDKWYQYKDVSVTVKQMCRDLDFTGNPKFIHHRYEPISERELEAFSMLYRKKMYSDLMWVVRSYGDKTDAKVDIDCNINITL